MNNIRISVLKGYGILLVVLGHAICEEWHVWGGYSVRNFIYLFHLAIFYYASGYLYKDKYVSDVKTFVIKRVKSLYIPYVLYGSVFLILHNFFCFIGLYPSNAVYSSEEMGHHLFSLIKFNYFEALSGTFWFFKSLFVVSIGFELTVYATHKSKYARQIEVIALSILSIVGIIACFRNFPCNQTLGNLALLPIFYVGYYVSHNTIPLEAFLTRYNHIAALACFVFLVLNSNYEVSINALNIGTNPFIFYLCAFSGIYLMLYVADYTPRFFMRIIDYIGRNSLSIFIWHFLCFRLVSWIMIVSCGLDIKNLMRHPVVPEYNVQWLIIYLLVGVIGSLFIGYVIQIVKTKLIRI